MITFVNRNTSPATLHISPINSAHYDTITVLDTATYNTPEKVLELIVKINGSERYRGYIPVSKKPFIIEDTVTHDGRILPQGRKGGNKILIIVIILVIAVLIYYFMKK